MDTHTNRGTRLARRGGPLAAALALIAGAGLVLGCAAERKQEYVRRTVTTTVQPPPAMTDIAIVNLRGQPSSDPATEQVVGTIINHGDRPVSQLSIRVEALDSQGRIVESVTTPVLAESIAAGGGQTTFTASLPRDPTVTTYHAVAIAR